MPVILLERIPLPSLRTYTSISVLLLSCSVFYAYQCVQTFQPADLAKDPTYPVDTSENLEQNDPGVDSDVLKEPLSDDFELKLPYESFWWNVFYVLTSEIWCVWTVVNTAYCCLILLAKLIQKIVFGELRVVEKQHLKDKFWNFLFYKFIFIFGVMNVQTMDEVVVWVAWFSVLGFFHLLTQLSKDRFEYLSFSPTTPKAMHMKLLTLLGLILVSCMGLLGICALIGLQAGFTFFAFMAAECLILDIRCFHVLARYVIHLYEMNVDGVWENRSIYIYYTELIFELSAISIDFCHHLHMLLWGNIFLSMASLVICMQLRFLFYEFKRRLNRHKNYRKVVQNIEARFPMATEEEITDHNDNCAVCWEKMESSRKLPCGHLFHNACLLSWLEQDTSCPTCRMSLSEGQQGDPNGNVADNNGDARPNVPHPPPQPNPQTTNHFFHFDGSRYVSWLPSFSVEVTHTQLLPQGGVRQPALQTSQLDNMARQVLSVFPHMPLSIVMEDLRNTRSVDFTIENILEGRLEAPPPGTLVTRAALGDSESEEEPANQQILLPSSISRTGAMAITSAINQQNNTQIYMDENVPMVEDNSEDFSEPSEGPSVYGGRFSKSTSEREEMLMERKNSMLEMARKKYLDKTPSNTHQSDLNSTEENPQTVYINSSDNVQRQNIFTQNRNIDDTARRRELSYQAAQRRFNSETPL